MNIGLRIRSARIDKGLSQQELADKMGYTSKTSICKVERGDDNITLDRVAKFSKALDVSVGYLMGWDDDNTTSVDASRLDDAELVGKILADKDMLILIRKIYDLPPEVIPALVNIVDAAVICASDKSQ